MTFFPISLPYIAVMCGVGMMSRELDRISELNRVKYDANVTDRTADTLNNKAQD